MIRRALNGLLRSSLGKKFEVFLRWKALPNYKFQKKEQAATRIERKLDDLIKNRLRGAFESIKEEWYRA